MENAWKKRALLGVCACAAFFAAAGAATAAKVVVRIDEFTASPTAAPHVRNISFQDLLKTEFNKLGKLDAAKRDELTTAVEEIQNSQSGLFDSSTAQQLGGFKSAQLGLTGALELIDRNRDRGMSHQYTARAVLRCTKLAEAIESTRTVELTDYVQSPSDLFAPLAAKVAREFTMSIYPIKIAAVNGDDVVLNYGSAVLHRGDQLEFVITEEVRDPDTGEVISTGSRRAGLLRVVSAEERSAVADILEGQPDIGTKCKLIEAAETDAGGPAVGQASAGTGADGGGSKTIAVTGEKPTLAIGKFKYSNEFDLSQTADRGGRPITSGGAGQGSGAVLGMLIGSAVGGTKGAVGGALAGQTFDSERRQYGDNPGEGAHIPRDQRETAIEKESQVLREMVLTKAQKSGKFTITEQTRKDEIKDQMDLEADGDYDAASLARRGRMQAARYIVFGTITRFETFRKQTGFSIMGGNETTTMKVTLDMRLVDNELGTVVISDQVTGQIDTANSQMGFLGLGTASESQGEIGQLLDVLAQNIIAKMVTTLWPIKIVQVSAPNKLAVINAGESIVSPGQRLAIYGTGGAIVDPETGEVLGHEETPIGEIEVYEVQPRFSKCRILKPLQHPETIQVGHICRLGSVMVPVKERTPAPAAAPASRKPTFTF